MPGLRGVIVVIGLLGAAAAGAAAPLHAPSAPAADLGSLIAEAKKAMMADPKTALATSVRIAAQAEGEPRSLAQQEALATGLWLKGEALTRINDIGRARRAIEQARAIASADGRETRLDGDLALSLARLDDSDGNIGGALQHFQAAHDIFARLKWARGESLALEGLGAIYDKAHDFSREVAYYRDALRVYSDEPGLELSIKNNLGFALQQQGKYREALGDFRRALELATAMKSPFLEARIVTNIAAVYARQKRFAQGEKAANRALKLLHSYGDNGWAPFVWGIKAELAYDRHDLKAASHDLRTAFAGQDLAKTIPPFRDMHKIAYKVYRALGNYKLAFDHLEAFKRLDDDGRSLASSANLALMNAKFDFQNQRLEIARLQSDRLKHAAALRRSQARMQMMALAAALALTGLVLAWIGWRHRILRRHRDQIGRANVELKRTLEERDAEIGRRRETETRLRIAKELAEQASRAKSHFLANMSHELRTPLNAIIGFSEILALGMTPEKAQAYAGDIMAGGRKLLDILDCTLDMAELEAGTVALAEDTVVLGTAVQAAWRHVAQELDTGRRHFSAGGDLGIRVRADSERLRQVLENVISNAAKFTGEEGRIEVHVARTPGAGVDIAVSDNGPGMAQDQLARVMEPFGQVESPYVRSHGGIGLGLPIVKSLVELHGGRLSLRSRVGAGTCVLIHLPEARLMAEPAAAAS